MSILIQRRTDTFVVTRGRCFRSQKKTGMPYRTTATFAADGAVDASSCECAAKEGLCNHALALLRLVALLKGQGYAEAPPEVSCTELPHQWRRPRDSRIAATSLDGVDWRSVREGGSSKPVGSRLYDARKRPRDLGEMEEAMRDLGSGLGESPFARHLGCVQVLGTDSTFGVVPEGSPLAYQQPLAPHGFQTYVSPNIALCARGVSTAQQPTWLVLFDSMSTFKPSTGILATAEWNLLEELFLTPDEARELEQNSRQQSKSMLWKAARKNRLTASAFGVAKSRESWTTTGLDNLTAERDLSKIRAVKHGITHEPQAVAEYEKVLRHRGHNIQTSCCGLVVDPRSPWLGASPDRMIFDSTEAIPHGVVEAKCPCSMWLAATPDSLTFYMAKDTAGVYRLNRGHNYYYQLLGQMALSGQAWGDFVVYCKNVLIFERIEFSLSDWTSCKETMDKFYFNTLLPYLLKKRNM
ncbi:uncharacterized protein LOC115320338 isoform X1 [Ixodes scapularis]|uniref:uncharacterized protein LOC115320338 isoform X1 n=2 Tax=Ixodes scapularis TaxID=6945 RepID=UPI001C389B83|nr:uncharacterized protein LOC115320338 isoform X1 [Ixodes scapularis]